MKDINKQAGAKGPTTTPDNDTHPNPTISHTNIVINKLSHPERDVKAAHTVTKARAISKKQVDTELREARQRQQSESDVIARIVRLGKILGHSPTYLDLYCAGFEPTEIAAISDLLQPLLASDEDAEVIPWTPLEVMTA